MAFFSEVPSFQSICYTSRKHKIWFMCWFDIKRRYVLPKRFPDLKTNTLSGTHSICEAHDVSTFYRVLIFIAAIIEETKCLRFTKSISKRVASCESGLLCGIRKYGRSLRDFQQPALNLKALQNLMPGLPASSIARAGFTLAHTKAIHLFISPKFRACTVDPAVL